MSSEKGGLDAVADGVLASYEDGVYASDAAADILADAIVASEYPEALDHAEGILRHLASEDVADDDGFPADMSAAADARAAAAMGRARKRAGL